ncbi:hypothetical protein OB2597_13168 [Pseudooceanicola batsensis HTCC2597]|uniref:non-specific protein-tyrosine kinase n=1 Tax=Pseudooceanicola batsensis (strain ATCC BAA-863 / DSM 15984 / KCTC 12145 / HTCC2597) TaxID=252305 RepID=A3TY62_PSEBH|nr:polysaccharide biosynthesis tyrosine autokinase [Pseudooceanicola batsensis]EAQ03096.1 hypothetical protein OB2597_13168 [Pseudooceanicola batsensis HTCC2597]
MALTKIRNGEPQTQFDEKNEIDLGEILGTLWRGKLIIAAAAVVALFIGAYYAFFQAVPLYTATSSVTLESREEQIVDIESVVTGLSGDQATINTEIEVLKSRGLITGLVRDMDLVDDPEFNVALRDDSGVSIGSVLNWIRTNILGRTLSDGPRDPQIIEDKVVDAVLESVTITNPRQTYVFYISIVTRDPQKSAAMANRMAELYIQDQIAVKFQRTEKATEWLTERVSDLRIELENAETRLKSFSTNTDLISPEGLYALNRQIKELRDRRADLEQQLAAAEARSASLRKNSSESFELRASLTGDDVLNRLLTRVSDGDADARESFDARYETLVARSEQELGRVQQQLAILDTSIEDLAARIDRQSNELVSLQQYQREADASRLIYEHFLSRLKETSVQQGIQQADSRVLSQAVIPLRPSAPRKTRVLALALILGVIAGSAIVLLREAAQNTYRVSENLEKDTGMQVIGQIPLIPARRRKNVLKYLSEKPNSAAAESIRNLRTSILLADLDNPPKVIMSTSSVPGEGKTTQSLAMAQNLSGLGKKVLLIEGDIRRRVFSQYFEIESDQGLLAVLSGETTLQEAVRFNDQLNADILIGEKSKVNAADVFSSERFHKFLDEARAAYDYIIIDTPPVLAVPDARVIGQSVDAIMYGVKWDSTTRRQVHEGLKSFASVNVKVSGLVLTQISQRGMKRYGYGDSYGAYDSYYNN